MENQDQSQPGIAQPMQQPAASPQPVPSAPAPAPEQQSAEPAWVEEKKKLSPEDAQDIVVNRQFAAISYLYVLSAVIYFTKRDSKFAKFHAKQGLVLFALSMLFLLTPALIKIPVEMVLFAGMVVGTFQAANGFYYKIPVIYSLTLGKLPESEINFTHVKFSELMESAKKSFNTHKQNTTEQNAAPSQSAAQPSQAEEKKVQ